MAGAAEFGHWSLAPLSVRARDAEQAVRRKRIPPRDGGLGGI